MILYGTLGNQPSICGQIDPPRPALDYEIIAPISKKRGDSRDSGARGASLLTKNTVMSYGKNKPAISDLNVTL